MTNQTPAKTDAEECVAETKDIVKHRGERTSGGGITRLVPKTFGELENLAVMLGKSDMVPKDMIGKPANILLSLMFGNEIGLTPAQALQNIMVVNGRPTLWGDATMGLVMASDVYEDSKDAYDPTTQTATFSVKRKGKEWLVRTFSKADAIRAKLWEKEGPWQGYPQRMLFHRARSWALRDAFPDVLKGIRYFEEERDIVETTAERVPAKDYTLPRETGQAAAAPAAAAPAQSAAKPEDKAPEAKTFDETFRCGGGATTEFEGDPDCYVIRDDQDPPTKYFHKDADYHAMAKAAKAAKGFLTGTWIEKPSKGGPVRWLVALSLKS